MDELDNLLSKRVVPQASPALAERIIARTQVSNVKNKKPGIFSTWFENFTLQPVYALAFMFMLMLAAGIYFNTTSSFTDDDDMAMYMVYDTLTDTDSLS